MSLSGGDSLAVIGPSGSGKSTLLNIIGTLDTPDQGALELSGRDPFSLDEPDLARFRNNAVGFVFQDHHLLPQYSVMENVLLPVLAFGNVNDTFLARAKSLLDRVGLGHRLDYRPEKLSGGERQRTALARAQIMNPPLLLADEPTGNLDGETAQQAGDLLLELHREANNILIVVTHSEALAARMQQCMRLVDGRLEPVAPVG
nr:ABC transporter ATP-binding protein [Acanthopleuribacter pedis]